MTILVLIYAANVCNYSALSSIDRIVNVLLVLDTGILILR